MRFMVDECSGPNLARWLAAQGHDVFSVYEHARGMADEAVLAKAFAENRILITNDKDFGEKVHRERLPHHGVVLLRLENETDSIKIQVMGEILALHADVIAEHFLVATEKKLRVSRF
jgi:predicted nuclease of predicted toxin-antitoxin system